MEWENVVAGQRADPAQINKIGNQVAKYKGLRLARRIVLTEVVATIEFNTDNDGNALNSTLGGELLFYSGANSSVVSSTECYIQLNARTENVYWYNSGTETPYIAFGYIGSAYSQAKVDIFIINEFIMVNSAAIVRNSSSGGVTPRGGGMTVPQTAVTAIKLLPLSGTFPAGTVVEWWERG